MIPGSRKQKQLSAWEDQVKGVYEKIREYRFSDAKNKPNARDEVEKLKAQFMVPIASSPAAFKAVLKEEHARWAPIIAAGGIKVE